jgi:hypothetical protein
MLPTIPVTSDCVAAVFKSPDNKRTTCLQVRYGDQWYVAQISRTVGMQWLEHYPTMWEQYTQELNEDTVYAQLALNFVTE